MRHVARLIAQNYIIYAQIPLIYPFWPISAAAVLWWHQLVNRHVRSTAKT